MTKPLVEAGFQVIMVDFRGYGKSTGKPTHLNVAEDGQKFFNYITTYAEPKKLKKLIMKIYSRFKGTDLSCSMLANFVMPQRRDRGAMAAMGRRRPPWSGCIFLPASA